VFTHGRRRDAEVFGQFPGAPWRPAQQLDGLQPYRISQHAQHPGNLNLLAVHSEIVAAISNYCQFCVDRGPGRPPKDRRSWGGGLSVGWLDCGTVQPPSDPATPSSSVDPSSVPN
jgi:hypothetical protein